MGSTCSVFSAAPDIDVSDVKPIYHSGTQPAQPSSDIVQEAADHTITVQPAATTGGRSAHRSSSHATVSGRFATSTTLTTTNGPAAVPAAAPLSSFEPCAPTMLQSGGAAAVSQCTASLTFAFDPPLNCDNGGGVTFVSYPFASSVDFAQASKNTQRTRTTTFSASDAEKAGPLTPIEDDTRNPFGLPVIRNRVRWSQQLSAPSSQRSRSRSDASGGKDRSRSPPSLGAAPLPTHVSMSPSPQPSHRFCTVVLDPSEWSPSSSLKESIDDRTKSIHPSVVEE